jgi:hypothetical protein
LVLIRRRNRVDPLCPYFAQHGEACTPIRPSKTDRGSTASSNVRRCREWLAVLLQKANDPTAIVGRRIQVHRDEVTTSIDIVEKLGRRLFAGVLHPTP